MRKLFFFSALGLSTTLFGQSTALLQQPSISTQGAPASPVQAVMPAQGGVAPLQSNQGNPSMGLFESAGAERTMDKIFDPSKDSFDVNEGMLNWKGKTFAVGDSRVVRARFERYLATPIDSQNYAKYERILKEIEAILIVQDPNITKEELAEKVRSAWSRLFDAAEYTFDGNSSIAIANIVSHTWNMRGDFYSLQWEESMSKDKLERYKKAGQGSIIATAQTVNQKMEHSKKATKDTDKQLADALTKYNQERLTSKLADQAASTASKTLAREASSLNVVFEFQSAILTYISQRKFLQAEFASMFYRHMFKASRQEMVVGKESFSELFGVSNYVPEMGILTSLAMDARKDVQDGMKAVDFLYSDGQYYSALERLMEAFLLGEYEPVLVAFGNEKKLKLLEIYKKSATIKRLVDSKDWGGIEAIAIELGKIAKDYPTTEVLSRAKAAQRASNMHVLAAKQAASLGKIEDVKKSLGDAAMIWPLNPNIESFNEELVGLTQGVSKYIQKFDELYERKNYRDIVAEAPEYAIALRQDKERAANLREIVIKISQIDSLIAQAQEFVKQRNPYFAWDILENARAVDDSDPALSRALANLAPEVSDYVKVLSKAKSAEENKQYAAALNYYLAAQEIFPASQACRLGIERVASRYTIK